MPNVYLEAMRILTEMLTQKRLKVKLTLPLSFFQSCIFYRAGETLLFMTFNSGISNIFPESFFQILIRLDILTLPCYRLTNDIST